MRGPRPTEGQVNGNYRSDGAGAGASSYGRSGSMDAPLNIYNSNS